MTHEQALTKGYTLPDPHPAWLQEWKEIRDARIKHFRKCDEETPETEALFTRAEALGDLIAKTEAMSVRGCICKLEWMALDCEYDFGCSGHREAIESAISALRAL